MSQSDRTLPEDGLTGEEAARRLSKHGPNEIKREQAIGHGIEPLRGRGLQLAQHQLC